MKKINQMLGEINSYMALWGDGGFLSVSRVEWYQEWKRSSYSCYMTKYRNPNRIGYNLRYNNKLVKEKLSLHLIKRTLEVLNSRCGNGENIEFELKRYK